MKRAPAPSRFRLLPDPPGSTRSSPTKSLSSLITNKGAAITAESDKQIPSISLVLREGRLGNRPSLLGSVYIYPITNPLTARQAGSVGGHVAPVDGSVQWKPIKQMRDIYWTYSGEGGHRGSW